MALSEGISQVAPSTFFLALDFPTHINVNSFLKYRLSCVSIVQGMSPC